MLQPTTIPMRALTEIVIPSLLPSLATVDVDEEMMGEAGAPGCGADEVDWVDEGGERAVVSLGEETLEDVWSAVLCGEVEEAGKAAGVTGWPLADGGQPMGSCSQGSTRQQPL